MEPFRQLAPEATLWRTFGGQCAKASGSLLLDCAPSGDGSRRGRREERCSHSIADHRLFKVLGGLADCVAGEAAARGDACPAEIVKAILPGVVP